MNFFFLPQNCQEKVARDISHLGRGNDVPLFRIFARSSSRQAGRQARRIGLTERGQQNLLPMLKYLYWLTSVLY